MMNLFFRKKTLDLSPLDLRLGQPTMFKAYWDGVALPPLAPINYHRYSDKPHFELIDTIKQIHQLHNNSNLNNSSEIIIGNGATQLLHAAIYAFKELKQKKEVYFYHPHWPYLPHIATQNGLILPPQHSESAAKAIKIATIPNNPDNYIPNFLWSSDIIVDACYNWPHYIPHVQQFKQSVVIFSLAKMLGLPALRIGWAVVNNKQVAKLMKFYIETNTLGVNLPTQQLANFYLKHELHAQQVGLQTAIAFGAETLKKRWESLEAAPLPFAIQNVYKNGMFLWGYLPNYNLTQRLQTKYNILALTGAQLGTSHEFARINIGGSEQDFNEFIERIKKYA